MTSGARHRTRACRHRDADRRLQKRAAIVSRLFFTMKIPTTACGGAVRWSYAIRSAVVPARDTPRRSRHGDISGRWWWVPVCAGTTVL